MPNFTVQERTQKDPATAVEAEDGLEAASLVFPDWDFETLDVSGSRTYVLCIQTNKMYVATQLG